MVHIKSRADSLAISLLSFKRTAHSLMLRSTSRVDAARRLMGSSMESQKKQRFSGRQLGALDRLALTGLEVFSSIALSAFPVFSLSAVSASFLFLARSNLVLLKISLTRLVPGSFVIQKSLLYSLAFI